LKIQYHGGLSLAKKQDDFQIPKEALERLARSILPEIQKFFESEEGKREFEEWKEKQGK
jgi:hypothetical protein